MEFKPYIVDKVLHWSIVLMLLFMLNLSTELHYTNWEIKGPLLHRQEAVQFHAMVGIIVLLFIIVRAIFTHVMRGNIPRLPPKNNKHALFIKVIHVGMYFCLLALVFTGIGLINNYEIPLSIYGIELTPVRENFLKIFPTLHDIHLVLQNVFWWLVAIHFVGFIYAKK